MSKQSSFTKIPHFALLQRLARGMGINVWLVGGFLRDIVLRRKRVYRDFDFCIQKDVLLFVKAVAAAFKAPYIVLDKSKGSYRVILKRRGVVYTYDFTQMRGLNLEEDLAARDFTINTLAYSLMSQSAKVIDRYGARDDLKRKRIRMLHHRVIKEDPLRILRGFSFMANYQFRIEPQTEAALARHKNLLKNVSSERINEELFKILSADNAYRTVARMSALRIFDVVLPEITRCRGVRQGKYHHLPVWAHSLETLRMFESFYRRQLCMNQPIEAYLQEELAQGRRRIHIVKLACLLHDIGKPIAKRTCQNKTIFHTHEKIGRDLAEQRAVALRLSSKEIEVLKKLIFWHLRPGYLADTVRPSERAIYRFFRDAGQEGVSIILLSFADWRATRGPMTDVVKRRRHERIMLGLVKKWFADQERVPLKKLINGNDIMKRFSLPASPLVGVILERIKEDQALGTVLTKHDAYALAKKVLGEKKRAGAGSKRRKK